MNADSAMPNLLYTVSQSCAATDHSLITSATMIKMIDTTVYTLYVGHVGVNFQTLIDISTNLTRGLNSLKLLANRVVSSAHPKIIETLL